MASFRLGQGVTVHCVACVRTVWQWAAGWQLSYQGRSTVVMYVTFRNGTVRYGIWTWVCGGVVLKELVYWGLSCIAGMRTVGRDSMYVIVRNTGWGWRVGGDGV